MLRGTRGASELGLGARRAGDRLILTRAARELVQAVTGISPLSGVILPVKVAGVYVRPVVVAPGIAVAPQPVHEEWPIVLQDRRVQLRQAQRSGRIVLRNGAPERPRRWQVLLARNVEGKRAGMPAGWRGWTPVLVGTESGRVSRLIVDGERAAAVPRVKLRLLGLAVADGSTALKGLTGGKLGRRRTAALKVRRGGVAPLRLRRRVFARAFEVVMLVVVDRLLVMTGLDDTVAFLVVIPLWRSHVGVATVASAGADV